MVCRRGQRGDTQERQLRVRSPRRPEKELEARKSPPRRQPSSGEGGLDAAPVRPSEVVEPEGGRVGSQQRLSAAPARSTGLRADRARNKHPAVTEPRHGCFSSKQPHFTSPELTRILILSCRLETDSGMQEFTDKMSQLEGNLSGTLFGP